MVEEEKAYAVHAGLPGAVREDRSEGRVLRSERYYGKLYRAFQLADAIDESAAEAKYSDGVLELRLPKKAVNSAKRLEIQ